MLYIHIYAYECLEVALPNAHAEIERRGRGGERMCLTGWRKIRVSAYMCTDVFIYTYIPYIYIRVYTHMHQQKGEKIAPIATIPTDPIRKSRTDL